jgi:hypothetical protein
MSFPTKCQKKKKKKEEEEKKVLDLLANTKVEKF